MSEQHFLTAVGELDTDLVAEYLTMREASRAHMRPLPRTRRIGLAAALLLGVCSALLTVVGIHLAREPEGIILMESTAVAPWLFVIAAVCLAGTAYVLVVGLRRRK